MVFPNAKRSGAKPLPLIDGCDNEHECPNQKRETYALPVHHIIPKHEWFERFGNMNGVNAIDNVVKLTLHQHAEVHLLLYELNHNENDLLAHQACVGMLLKKKPVRRYGKKHKAQRKKRNTRNQYRKWSL
jgi:hypothetical protein